MNMGRTGVGGGDGGRDVLVRLLLTDGKETNGLTDIV